MGSAFRSTSALLEISQWWSKERIAAYQLERLREVVSNAAKNVPGYRLKFAEHGVGPESIGTLDDIRRFPCLTKQDLRDAPELYVTEAIPRERLHYVTSGGTTGTPTGFYHISEYNDNIAAAFRLMMWKRIGYSPRLRAVDLTGSFGGGPLHYYPDRNLLCVSISALDCQRFPSYADDIRAFRPQFLIGFPSTVALLAQLVKHFRLSSLQLRGIIVSSEVMYEGQRRVLSEVFGGRILQWYGLAEYAGFASGCEQSDEYHFFPESCYLELLDAQGLPVTAEGGEGEIVLTGFHNVATPFIRYRTGDRAVLGASCCRWCGRNYPTLREISGRIQEFLVARSGRLIPSSALNVHDGLFDEVWSYQFCQDTPGKVVLNVLGKHSYSSSTTERIRRFMLEKLGGDIELELCFPKEIPRTPRGKHAFIVQKLQLPGGGASSFPLAPPAAAALPEMGSGEP
jgi:phenylacetate-CoA ligase